MIMTSAAICIKGQLITGQRSVVKTATGQHHGQKWKEQKEVSPSSLQACIDCTEPSRVAVCGFLESYSTVISQFPWLICKLFLIRDVWCANVIIIGPNNHLRRFLCGGFSFRGSGTLNGKVF